MIHRLVLQNFMTHKQTVLELHPGVTVLTGPNNTGKSAVVEALRCVSENPPSAQLIRHGATKAVVRLELDDGSWIQWERTSGSAVYKVRFPDGREETYAKVGRSAVPEDIQALLRLHSLPTESGPVDVHIGNQKAPIFLLDQSGSQAAGFFAASTEADYLLAMQQVLKEKTVVAQRERKRLKEELEQLEKAILALAPLPAMAQEMKQAEDLYAEIEAKHRAIPLLESFIQRAESLKHRLDLWAQKSRQLQHLHTPPQIHDTALLKDWLHRLEKTLQWIHTTRKTATSLARLARPPELKNAAVLQELISAKEQTRRSIFRLSQEAHVLNRMKEPPSLRNTEPLARLTQRLDETLRRRHMEIRRKEVTKSLKSPPELQPVQGLFETVKALKAVQRSLRSAHVRHHTLVPLTPPPEIHSLGELLRTIQASRSLQEKMRSLKVRSQKLKSVNPPPDVHDLKPLQQLVENMGQLQQQWHRARNHQKNLEEQLKQKRHAVEELLAKLPLCPFCRQPMDPEHFLEPSHA